jgi:hypothetical protein
MSDTLRFWFVSYFFIVVCSLLLTFFSFPNPLSAQSFTGGSPGISLSSNPRFPGAYGDVEISLDDYQINTAGATITWYVDSVEQVSYKNTRSITVTTGALGKKSVVSVIISRNNAPQLTSSITLIPTEVHIILEAQTYVPNFYRGRALPSIGSEVRAIAVVEDGTKAPANTYAYTWTEENTVLFGGPIKGKYAYEFTMPRYGTKRLSVEVTDGNGKLVGGGVVSLTTSKPELHFYEQSPLRGLSQKVVTSPFPLIGAETTIYGEPYFITAGMNATDASFTWKINNEKVEQNTTNPNAITLQRVGDSGKSQISLEILTRRQIPELLKDTFNLIF